MSAKPLTWTTRGFDAFRRGSFGNAGQNLYVSRAGVLQRIHLFDLNRDGWIDLTFCNSQEFLESPPAYLYVDPLRRIARIELRADGAATGIVADLNGDGLDDLVLGMETNGARDELNAFVYYGSPEGLTERYHIELPVPKCSSVAAGDFNGDGRCDLAFLSRGKLRLFYASELGFEPKRFKDLPITALQLAAADLDGDGCADLYCLAKDAPPRIYWGGPDGLRPDRFTDLPAEAHLAGIEADQATEVSETERIEAMTPRAKILTLAGLPHLFVAGAASALLLPVLKDRRFGAPLRFDVANAYSVDAGDVNGDGHPDLAFAARDRRSGPERSWLYWGGPQGFSDSRRVPLPSARACDVAVGDLNEDGCAEVALCQSQDADSYSVLSPIYRGLPGGVDPRPVLLPTEGARRVFIARPAPDARPALLFVNFHSRRAIGDACPAVFLGGPDGYRPDRRVEFDAIGAAASLICDLNDDGRPDIVIANSSENAIDRDPGSFIYLASEHGFPEKPSIVLPTRHAFGLALADLNRDGCLDLIVCGFQNPDVVIYYGAPGGFDLDHPCRIRIEDAGLPFDEQRRMLLADLNADGWLDLVVTEVTKDRTFILWGGPDGFSLDRRQVLSVLRPSCPEAVDLTGSGRLDLLIASHAIKDAGPHESFLYIYWNGPDGLRQDRRTQLPVNGVLGLAVADFNNDGLLDILCCSYRNDRERDLDSVIYWGRPGGNYSPGHRTFLRTHSASGCIAADFNEDGWIDVAIANHKTYGDHVGESFVWWNGPDGFDRRRVTRLPTVGPHGMTRVQPGNQRDRGPEEYYTSEPFELPAGLAPHRIDWTAELPPKTWLRAQLRRAPTREALHTAPWQGPDPDHPWHDRGDRIPPLAGEGPWLQYRLALGSLNSGCTPRVTEVRIDCAPQPT
jgi:hypothetical protein